MSLFSTLNSPFLECPLFTFAFPEFNIYLLSFFLLSAQFWHIHIFLGTKLMKGMIVNSADDLLTVYGELYWATQKIFETTWNAKSSIVLLLKLDIFGAEQLWTCHKKIGSINVLGELRRINLPGIKCRNSLKGFCLSFWLAPQASSSLLSPSSAWKIYMKGFNALVWKQFTVRFI